jgi:carboxymethylenebutenolidase
VIFGTATEDQVLTADASGLSDADGLGTFSYQWQSNGVAIIGATNSTYTLGDADVGQTIKVVVSYTDGHGTAEDVGAKVRAAGGIPDDQVLGDLDGANKLLRALPYVSAKVGVFGTCSGGRHGFLAACRLKGIDALVECWGGNVVQKPEELTPKRPVAPIDYTKDLSCPMIGLFGNDDKSPSPEQVNMHEAELKKHGKNYVFHRYDGAGHGFFYYDRPAYRQEQAVDGWKKVLAFCEKNLK